MNPYAELKSLLYGYLALLRAPGGGEQIEFAIQQHIDRLDLWEIYGHPFSLRDLPEYRESAPRGEHGGDVQGPSSIGPVLP